MAKGLHKGTELANVKETWSENEKSSPNANDAISNSQPAPISNDLQQTISEEAAEYDNANKEDRLLSGDRATVADE